MKTTDKHVEIMEHVITICRMAILTPRDDLTDLVNQFAYEDTMGPLRNPTQYMAVGDKFQNVKKTLDAFMTFYQQLRRIDADERVRVAKERRRNTT